VISWKVLGLAVLLLAAAGCTGLGQHTPTAKAPASASGDRDCRSQTFDYEDAYADQAAEAGRIYYATYRLADCSIAYGLGYEGEITEKAVGRLISSYRQDSKENDVRFLVLNSLGGSVRAGLMMAQFLIDEDLAAIVGERMICVSMCSFVFITANRRVMGDNARLGIHSASDYSGRPNRRTNFTLASLLTMVPGAHAEAYLSIANATPPDEVTWLTAHQARSLGFTD